MAKNLLSDRSGRSVANQFVIKTSKGVFFQSYDTVIAKIDKEGKVTLGIDNGYYSKSINLGFGLAYSRTTYKYLCKFLREYGNYECNANEIRKALKLKEFKISKDLKF